MQEPDRLLDSRQRRHGLVLDLEGNRTIVTHHAEHSKKFLPPLRTFTKAERDVIPVTVVVVIKELGLQSAVGREASAFLAQVFCMNMVDGTCSERARRAARSRQSR